MERILSIHIDSDICACSQARVEECLGVLDGDTEVYVARAKQLVPTK